MQFPESSIENLSGLGYTEDEARFLYLVATHSGYFSTRQYLGFTRAKTGEKNMAFTQKVLGKGHATARLLLRNGRVYHLFSRIVYRAIRREHLRNRREHSVEHIRTKLAILDFVLAHLDYRYLETEPEKVEYLCKELGVSREALPAKRYAGAIREKTTDRYFVDKFPRFFVPVSSSFSPVVTFSFVDPGLLSLASFETHLLDYSSLFSAVPQIDFVYIATRPTHFQAAREMAQGMAPRVLNPDPGVEGLRYFHSRYLWETKRYNDLSMEEIESLDQARKRFTDARIEVLFQPWMHGQITCDVVMKRFSELAPTREVPFRTELVDGQAALFEAKLPSRKSRKTETQVNGAGDRLSVLVSAPFSERKPRRPKRTNKIRRQRAERVHAGKTHSGRERPPLWTPFRCPRSLGSLPEVTVER